MATKLIPPPDIQKEEVSDGNGAVMGFFDHIDELRVRLLRTVLGLAVGMIVSLIVASPVVKYIAASAITSNITLQAISPTENITIFFRVTLMLGAMLASPYMTWQVLGFIVPGLTSIEKRWLLRAIPATTVLFVIGVLFTWFLLMPAYISFLAGFQADVIKPIWTGDNYFGFVTSVLFWHGAAFETPIVFYALARIGILNANKMLKFWRHAVVASAVFAGVIAPTYDPMTMIVITIVLFTLYMLSVALVAFGVPNGWERKKKV